MNIKQRIDWDSMYKDFTQGWIITDFKKQIHTIHYPEPKELADRYECAVHTIYDRITFDRKQGIGDWRIHRKSIQAKRREEIGKDGGRYGFYVTESAKLDAIALDTIEKNLTLIRLETILFKQQKEYEMEQVEADPSYILKIRSQSQAMYSNVRTIAMGIDAARKIVGESITGIVPEAEKEQSRVTILPGEIDKLIERRKHLQERRERINTRKAELVDEGAS